MWRWEETLEVEGGSEIGTPKRVVKRGWCRRREGGGWVGEREGWV